jgi:hypothetical protein
MPFSCLSYNEFSLVCAKCRLSRTERRVLRHRRQDRAILLMGRSGTGQHRGLCDSAACRPEHATRHRSVIVDCDAKQALGPAETAISNGATA